MQTTFARIAGIAVTLMSYSSGFAQQLQPNEFTAAQTPGLSLLLTGGNQFIVQNGNTANNGTLLFVDQRGDQLAVPFIGGLPSGITPNGMKFGPLASMLDGNTIYIALGESDEFHSTGPRFRFGARTSFSAPIVKVTVSTDPAKAGPFLLTAATRQDLLSGLPVTLADSSNNHATFSLVADFGTGAHPVSLAVTPNAPDSLFVVDSASNRLLDIDLTNGATRTLTVFPSTPESVRALGPQLLVTVFSPLPNDSSVWSVDPVSGHAHIIVPQLTSAVDAVVQSKTGQNSVLVLENRADPNGSGRVLKVNSTGTVTTVLTDGLNDPTGLTIDETTGSLFIYSRGDGIIYSFALP